MRKKREPIIEGDIARIPLTHGKFAVIDVEDLPLVAGDNWCALLRRTGRYHAVRGNSDGTIFMHRVILPSPDDVEVDHIDGDGLNNRRKNLRRATRQQNGRNRGKTRANTSGFKGVFRSATKSERWRACIVIDGLQRHLGSFGTREEASSAYHAAAVAHFGEFHSERNL